MKLSSHLSDQGNRATTLADVLAQLACDGFVDNSDVRDAMITLTHALLDELLEAEAISRMQSTSV